MATFSTKFRKSKQIYTQTAKDTKAKPNSTKTTVEGRHLKMIQTFDEEQTKMLPQKKKNLVTKQKQLEKLQIKKTKSKLEPIEYTMLNNLAREISALEKEIASIETKFQENEYLLDVADLLDEYDSKVNDSNLDNTASNNFENTDREQTVKKEQKTKNADIFNFLSPSHTSQKDPKIIKMTNEKVIPKFKGKITSYIEINDNNEKSREDILDKLMQLTDPTYVSDKLQKDRSMQCLCRTPDENKIIFNFTTGTHICEGCGAELVHFYDSQFTSYKESQEHDVPVDFPYVRMNHFNELIAQFQAKEQTDIPQQVFDDLNVEFVKEKIQNFNGLQYKLVKKKLQKLGHTNMYEHIPYIIHKFNGLPPPVLTLENEQQFRIMFKQIQDPFEKCKHLAKKNRKNFLSYSYVFYKFAELLGLDHLLRCFRLLKSREKLFAQDKVWKAICEIKEWEFIPSL